MSTVHRSACGDPVYERHQTPVPSPTGWMVPVVRVDVLPHEVQANIVTEREALVLMDAGSARLDSGFGARRVSCELTAGAIGRFTPGTEFRQSRWRWQRASRIVLDLEGLDHLCPELGEALPHRAASPELEFHDAPLADLMRGLSREASQGHPHGRLFADSLLLGLAVRLHRRADTPSRERGRLTPTQLRTLEEYLDHHLAEPMKMGDLARVAGFSPAHFARLLRNTVGLAPYDFVLERRLSQVRHLVLNSALPLALVAQETGFSSQSHMTRAFSRRFGAPPGLMRRSHGSDRLAPMR